MAPIKTLTLKQMLDLPLHHFEMFTTTDLFIRGLDDWLYYIYNDEETQSTVFVPEPPK